MATRDLYILRGLPSAGKTTLAQQLAPEFNTEIDSACRRVVPGNGNLTSSYLAALTAATALVEQWMREGRTPIAIAAVNAKINDVTPWTLLAIAYGYRWHVIHVESDFTNADLALRSQTQCPADAIAYFRASWQPWER